MSSNIPLLIELHESVWVKDEKDVWSGAFMADVCHIAYIESFANLTSLSPEECEKRQNHEIERSHFGEYCIPAAANITIVTRGCEKGIQVIETYEEIREKIAKAGVVVP